MELHFTGTKAVFIDFQINLRKNPYLSHLQCNHLKTRNLIHYLLLSQPQQKHFNNRLCVPALEYANHEIGGSLTGHENLISHKKADVVSETYRTVPELSS